jgi:hypothetical protein
LAQRLRFEEKDFGGQPQELADLISARNHDLIDLSKRGRLPRGSIV